MRQQEPGQSVASVAEVYERYMVPAAFALWAADLLALLALQPGSRVLDVACGTGIVARTAVHHTGATGGIVGLDLHAGMLAVAPQAGTNRSVGAGQRDRPPLRYLGL